MRRDDLNRPLRALTIRVAFTLLGLGGLGAAPLAAPKLTVAPGSGFAGATVALSASGFTPNPAGAIKWDNVVQMTFPVTSGSFSMPFTIPAGAAPGPHEITVCANCGGVEFEEAASATFTVVEMPVAPPITAVPPRPPTATKTPTRVPTRTPTPTATATELPSVCGDLGMGPEAVVVDFESLAPETVVTDQLRDAFGVAFEGSLQIVSPTIRAHSGSKAGASLTTPDFGSATLPIRMSFPDGVRAVGMYLGFEGGPFTVSDVTASLTAYGYRGGEAVVVRLGAASVSFPSAASDVKHCLEYEAAPGDVILRAVLETVDAAGLSTPERRILDDLTLLPASEPLPGTDQAPVVEIIQPPDGTVYRGGTVDVRVRVREDRELRTLLYTINGGEMIPTGFVADSGEPMVYMGGISFDASRLNPYVDNFVSFLARDGSGNVGDDTVHLAYEPPTPTPSYDIVPVKAEITQVIQCLNNPICRDNYMPLYIRKPTLVRVYVRLEGGTASVPNVWGEVCDAYRGEAPIQCYPSLGPITVTPTDDPVRDFRGNLDGTLNFLVPFNWVGDVGRHRLALYVNRDRRWAGECCIDNNRLTLDFGLGAGTTLHVVMMRISAHGATPQERMRGPAIEWVRRYYPTSEVHIYRSSAEPVDASYDYTSADGWSSLLTDLWWINAWTDDPVDWLRYHGMVPGSVPRRGVNGIAYLPGDESTAIMLDEGGAATAHEIGHNHGLYHTPSNRDAAGNLVGCGDPIQLNNSYPQYTDASGASLPRASIGEWGIDLYASPIRLLDPAATFDVMSYCSPKWMSLYSYTALARDIGRVADLDPGSSQGGHLAQLAQPASEVLLGAGTISPKGFELLKGFQRLAPSADLSLSPDEGPYAIELRDADGKSLMRRAFSVRQTGDNTDPDTGAFTLVVPWVDGTKLIAFLYQGQLLGGVPVSPNAPTVTLLEPNGGETWPKDGKVGVRWEWQDADEDTLRAMVQFSADDGKTWRAVVGDVAKTRVSLDASQIPGTSQGRIRVCVTDGANTTCDASDATFSVPAKPPEVYLEAPIDGSVFPTGQQVILQAYASDLEDGPIVDDAAFVWTSSLDGNLGTGTGLWGLPLSNGRHVITLTVTDRDGNQVAQSVTIVVGTDTGETPARPPLSILPLAGIGVLAVVGLTMILLAWKGLARRKR